jgi:hypothetical protein
MWDKSDPFKVGFHTRKICERIDRALEDFRNGKSTYLCIRVPYRHGKSDMLSRFLPPHFLGEFPEYTLINTAYSSSLAQEFSKDAREIINSSKFAELYPKVTLSKNNANVKGWGLSNGIGKTAWVGLDGSITGKGAHLALIDDPFKDRAEADSGLIRDKRWNAFSQSLFTRLAPVHIIIILATPWHVDDLFGRIAKKAEESKQFAKFETWEKWLCRLWTVKLQSRSGWWWGCTL